MSINCITMVYTPPISHYSHISVANIDDAIINEIMGYKGAYFKTFTSTMKLKYVWWNKETNVIELWGSFDRMSAAHNVMQNRIDDVVLEYSA